MKNSTTTLAVLLIMPLMTSCDKAERLRAQQMEVEKQRTEVQQQIQAVEDKLRSLGPNGMSSVSPTERSAAELLEKASSLETRAGEISSRWGAVEKQLNDLRPKVDAWKAKHLR